MSMIQTRFFTVPLIQALILALILTLCACAPPKALRGEYSGLTPQQAVSAAPGQAVRWGGMILSMQNDSSETCFEVLSKPLNANARPTSRDQDQGRFLACYPGYRDPEVYAPGREITVVGSLSGVDTRKVGEFEYPYPTVEIDDIHLWAEHNEVQYAYAYDPFLYPYPYAYAYPYPYAYYGPTVYYYYPVHYTPKPQPPEADEPTIAGATMRRPAGMRSSVAPTFSGSRGRVGRGR